MAPPIAAQRTHASLQQVLADRGRLATADVLSILGQLAEELARWHGQGRLHRAIGLETVIQTDAGCVQLAPPPAVRSFGGCGTDEEAGPWELQTERVIELPPAWRRPARRWPAPASNSTRAASISTSWGPWRAVC